MLKRLFRKKETPQPDMAEELKEKWIKKLLLSPRDLGLNESGYSLN